ncbi:MAG: hypothetical protein HWE21_18485 [Cytophagia bacterium]|nr:hypothetical protein [Cytophagia bacterium]NVK86322.1 hypothetical protein [Cytophagia bacterium]
MKKYWEADSSLQEEQELKDLLSKSTDTELEEEKALFAHFAQNKSVELDDSFDADLLAQIEEMEEQKGAKVISMKSYFTRYASIAAAVLVLCISGALYYQQQQQFGSEDTFDDPEVAYAELKKQLLLVSKYMNKGQNTLNELNNLSKASSELNDFAKLGEASEGLNLLSEMNVENN